jgi:preprotein translocase subunit SecA
MEALRVAIGLEAYAQRDPLVQYKTKAFEMFQKLLQDMRVGVATRVFTFQPQDVGSVQAALKKADVPAAQIPSNKR